MQNGLITDSERKQVTLSIPWGEIPFVNILYNIDKHIADLVDAVLDMNKEIDADD